MILKVNDTVTFNNSMTLNVDWKKEKISIEVKSWDKINHSIEEITYLAEEFSQALRKFEELEETFKEVNENG